MTKQIAQYDNCVALGLAVVGDDLDSGNLELVKSGDVTAAPLRGSVTTTVLGVDQATRNPAENAFHKHLTAKPIMVTKGMLANYNLLANSALPIGSRTCRIAPP